MKKNDFVKLSLLLLIFSFNLSHSNDTFKALEKSTIKINDTLRFVKKNNGKSNLAIDPPIITATGDQLYCPQTSIHITTTIDINHDLAETGTQAVFIQISSGYSNGFDQLQLSNPASHPKIITSWDATAGKLKLYSPTGVDVLYSEFEAAIKDVQFYNSSATASGIRTFSITIGQANYLPSTGHYYMFVPSIGITWTSAKAAAEASNYYGLKGYLATLLASDEAKLSGEQASGAGWIGGSDAETENVWKWVTGPEGLANSGNGIIFWNGLSNGSTPNFAFWNNSEPNQAGDEDYAHITAPGVGILGSWNDLSNTGGATGDYQPKGYIVEYGGMPGELPLKIAASTKITIPQVTLTNPNAVCDSGTFTLTATTTPGTTISWYDSAVSTTPLATRTSFTTPVVTTSTTYYADSGCITNRKSVVAIVNNTPNDPTVLPPAPRCGTGSVLLEATSNVGIINWFKTLSGGSSVYQGNNFTTPVISTNTTYYAEASNNGCINNNRTPVNIIIYSLPVVTDENDIVLCEGETIELDAKITGVEYDWSTGEKTQTIKISTPGTYTVIVTSPAPESCSSTKTITVIEYKKPIIKNINVDQQTVSINLENPEDYFEFSVDGQNYQSSHIFYDVHGGLQTAYVRTTNKLCAANKITQNFIVLIVPAFFTPNNDLHNDVWEVTGIENYPQAELTIFDRYGKLITKLSGSEMSWDGTFNKTLLPASDYWYALKIDNNTPLFRGHFSLKR
ncbi:T9SS type B sorting domain-containing protein [Flavobacterium sp.]|uniref:Ig-like domain-containing protein n=1 Tax=Flavobacterium sp. TaxID=239 RepID=UPI003265A8BF